MNGEQPAATAASAAAAPTVTGIKRKAPQSAQDDATEAKRQRILTVDDIPGWSECGWR